MSKNCNTTGKNYANTLKAFIDIAKGGNLIVDIFDIRYETSLEIKTLNGVIAKLIKNGEVEKIDRRYYKFAGDINQKVEAATTGTSAKKTQSQSARRKHLKELNDELELRRREVYRRMREEREKAAERAKRQSKGISVELSDFDNSDEYAMCVYKALVDGETGEMAIKKSFPISYVHTLTLLKRMLDDGYIELNRSKCGSDTSEYRTLITEEQFKERFCNGDKSNGQSFDEDDIAQIDKEFDEYISGCDDETADDERYDDDDEDWLDDEFFEDEEGESTDTSKRETIDLTPLYTKDFDMQKAISEVEDMDSEVDKVLHEPYSERAIIKEVVKKFWDSEWQFEDFCTALLEKIVLINRDWERDDALREAAREYIAVRDTQDIKVIQMHQRVICEIEISTDKEYEFLRDAVFANQ